MCEFNLHGIIKSPLRRIISLAPSITEMLFYLGLGEFVIGVTRQCDYPAAVSDKESVGSLLMPDTKRILELSPDCIIGISDLHRQMPEIIRDKDTGVILFDYRSVQGILDVMEAIASLAVDAWAALGLVASLRRRVDALRTSKSRHEPVKTLFLISESPIMLPSRNSYPYDALRTAGAAQITNSNTQYERVTFEEVIYFNPEIILACGHYRDQPPRKICPDCHSEQPICQRVVDDFALKPGWKGTSAAKTGNIIALPCHWLCRPGPRLVDGLESIAKILQRYKHE